MQREESHDATPEQLQRIVDTAAALLWKIDVITSDQFSRGAERQEREELRGALLDVGRVV